MIDVTMVRALSTGALTSVVLPARWCHPVEVRVWKVMHEYIMESSLYVSLNGISNAHIRYQFASSVFAMSKNHDKKKKAFYGTILERSI